MLFNPPSRHMHNENWTTILLLKQKASQKSFISFFNTLSRVRTPPNPATKNVTMPALFTTFSCHCDLSITVLYGI